MDCTKCHELEQRLEKRIDKLEKGHALQSIEIEALKISGTSASEQLKTLFRLLDEIKDMIKENSQAQKENYNELRSGLNSLRKEIEAIKQKDDKLLADRARKVIWIVLTVIITAAASGIVGFFVRGLK